MFQQRAAAVHVPMIQGYLGLDSSKCSLCASKAKKYKAALTTERSQAIWHSGFSVCTLLQGFWHLPEHQPPVGVCVLIPVSSGM